MQVDKQKRLSHITDEVGELHPLLKRLLPKMPTVQQVEYTHGPGEMGADFVVTRTDPALSEVQYVGVVAKVGRIVQDFADVERQISECWVPRYVDGGKKRVRLNAVWVVITQHITKGAQEKIHDKFEASSIKFIPGSSLETLIDKHIPDFWTSIDLDLGEYLSQVRDRNAHIDRALSMIRADDTAFYIEQDVIRVVDDRYSHQQHRHQKTTKVDIINEIESHGVLVVEGGMGSGKSKLLRHIVSHFATPEVFLANPLLPIPLTYKEFADDYGSDVDKVLTDKLTEQVREGLPDGAKSLMLIDGLDEKDQTLDAQIEALKSLAIAVANRTDVKVIIASRYLSQLNVPRHLGLAASRYELQPLRLKRVFEFLIAICSNLSVQSRLLEDLRKSPLFRELPRSPIAAIILAQLLNENADELPSNMTELYSKYLELMLGRWDIDKGLQSQKEYEALDSILMQLSAFMITNELVVVGRPEVEAMFNSYLRDRNLDIDPTALFHRALTRSDIIGEDVSQGTISFKHRTFAEFLYAKYLIKTSGVQVDNRVFQPYWTNVYFFALGLQKDSPVLLREIIALPPASEGELILKIVSMGSYLLAAYSTPSVVIVEGVTSSIRDAARFYVALVEGASNTFFARLPRMAALYLLQLLVRESYSFRFFREAIEDAALSVDASGDDNATKAYALFLLNVAYIDSGGSDNFDFLLERYDEHLPFDLSLAVRHETDRMGTTTTLMKKQDRRLSKLLKLKGSKYFGTQVKALYETPLRLLTPAKVNGPKSAPPAIETMAD